MEASDQGGRGLSPRLATQGKREIIVTAAVRDGLDPRFELRTLPPANVKGVAESIEIFAVDGLEAG